MELFIAVINNPNKIDEVLESFLEIGITGATIIDSFGMGKILSEDIPIFAGFRHLLASSSSANKTIFSVIDDEKMVLAAFKSLETICGNLNSPSTGIAFTIPVHRVVGLRPGWDD
jgi:nitrogen regulatory protein PII